MASISAPGSGSGLDVSGLVSQLIAAESQPAQLRLSRREARFQAEFSALGQVRSTLATFQASADVLKDAKAFEPRTASSGNEAVFTADATAKAVDGTYAIEVVRLASAQKLSSTGFSASTDAVGSGTLAFSTAQGSFSVSISSAANTLADVRDAINAATNNPGVSATLITVDAGGGGTEVRLSLSAADTGAANAISITAVDDDGNNTDTSGLSRLVYDPSGSGVTNLTQTLAPVDSQVRIDGALLTSSTNRITAAIDGVTLNLVAVNASPQTLTVARDRATVRDAINEFVSSYNGIRETINRLTAFDAASSTAGILIADSGVRSLSALLQRELGARVAGASSKFSTLTEIGISSNKDATLSVDTVALDAAFDADFSGVAALFSGANGVATRIAAAAEEFTRSQGLLDQRTTTLSERIDDIGDQRTALDRRMAAREASLLARFGAMDRLVAQLQATSSFLTQQLTTIGNLVNRPRSTS